ncbi:serine hydrolase domain-containing protein [Chachezhania sediminis]|uniref:serine hydrolase domain-containing protein n=1 Tax=Chachezhania sediminis TaxID=2599291 RepID=UPI00131DECEC|nr:serine hydrolase [Chachezhania sediminis]
MIISRRARLPLATTAILTLFLGAQAACADLATDIQSDLDTYLSERTEIEGNTGASVFVSLGRTGPDISVYSGTTARDGDTPVTGTSLFEIGSNTKGFTGVLILALEAQGLLSIDDTVGQWLPQYPEWKDVTIAQLLHMISGIPTYSESPELNHYFAEQPDRHFTMDELVDMAYPSDTVQLPPNSGYFYSNTNYILAGMIAEKAAGKPYRELVETLLFEPAGLSDTYYEDKSYTGPVLERMTSGYFNNPACTLYDEGCEVSELAPVIGRDVKAQDMSWAGPAGGIVASPRELATWIRAVFDGKVIPDAQLAEFLRPVSMKTGEYIDDVTDEDPGGFTLGITRVTGRGLDPVYFYLGMTLGYRMAFIYSPEEDVIVAGATNSQPPEGEEQFTPLLVGIYMKALAGKAR